MKSFIAIIYIDITVHLYITPFLQFNISENKISYHTYFLQGCIYFVFKVDCFFKYYTQYITKERYTYDWIFSFTNVVFV